MISWEYSQINQSISQSIQKKPTNIKQQTKKTKKGACKLTKICSRSHISKEGESHAIRRAQITSAARCISQG